MATTTAGPTTGTPTTGRRSLLLPGERVLAHSHDRVIFVTTHRVQYYAGAGGNSTYRSITLDSVSSTGVTTTSQPALLVLGAVLACFGLVMMAEKDKTVGPVLLGVGVVVALLYFVTRTAALAICSNGGERIVLPAPSSQRESLMVLLQALDGAKLAALGRIYETLSPPAPAHTPYPPPPTIAHRSW